MKRQLALLTLALVAILAACGVDATPTPVGPGATPTPTPTFMPALTPTPTPTLTLTPTPTPALAWLDALIAQHRRKPVTNPPVSIIERTYNGETVYFVAQRCCDIFSDLYDAAGVLIAHPDGGITGGGDGRAPGFSTNATFVRVVWQDTRGPDGSERVLVAAPIDFLEVVAIGRDPAHYQANVVSGLPNGCARFNRLTVELDRTARVFTIEILNLVPTPDANVGCTLQYGQVDHAVLLEGVEAGFAYTVNAHDASMSFAAK